MSLIGPRPLLPCDQPKNVDVRLMVRPGITGWAQVNGWRGETDTPEKIQQRVKHDYAFATQRQFPDTIIGNWFHFQPEIGKPALAEPLSRRRQRRR